jgi:DNA-binding response OmpR family regulator
MRLRKFIETDPANPTYLVSIRGTGYRFNADAISPQPADG